MKSCSNCVWRLTSLHVRGIWCLHPKTRQMDGMAIFAQMAREDEYRCGTNARYFEAKPPPQPSLWKRLVTALSRTVSTDGG